MSIRTSKLRKIFKRIRATAGELENIVNLRIQQNNNIDTHGQTVVVVVIIIITVHYYRYMYAE